MSSSPSASLLAGCEFLRKVGQRLQFFVRCEADASDGVNEKGATLAGTPALVHMCIASRPVGPVRLLGSSG